MAFPDPTVNAQLLHKLHATLHAAIAAPIIDNKILPQQIPLKQIQKLI
jgi:hypothetical protein